MNSQPDDSQARIRVAVVDMQPITPAVGGGRLRLLGLYQGLGSAYSTRYVGTYDWPGEHYRELRLSESLMEIAVPLSAEHFRRDTQWKRFAGGTTIIDAVFPILGRLSGDFLQRARGVIAESDVVIFSHPWVYPLLSGHIDRQRQLLVYDAHNVEGLLRYDLLGQAVFNREIAKGVVMTESFLARDADIVIACSEQDTAFFQDAYGVAQERLFVVPNGVFIRAITPADRAHQASEKISMGLTGPAVVFVGSNFRPNLEAVEFICRTVATSLPEMTFLVCGGVGEAPSLRDDFPRNVRVTGRISDEEKLAYLQVADAAVNPMFSGSGTNIKMFDFMAAGLPVVTTEIGARGITAETKSGVIVCQPEAIAEELAWLLQVPDHARRLGQANRRWVEKEFAWEALSPAVGELVGQGLRRKAASNSVVFDHPSLGADAERAGFESALSRPIANAESLAILSTLGIRCGIAEYTTYLAAALLCAGVRITFIANLLEGHDAAAVPLSRALRTAHVERLWHYDNERWTESRVDPNEVLRLMQSKSISHLNIQYHRGFFPEPMLVDLVRTISESGAAVSVTLHNSGEIDTRFLHQLARLSVSVLVHKHGEQSRLRQIGIKRVFFIPQGVRDAVTTPDADLPFERDGSGPVLGTFGFLRPHKGLFELVDAMEFLRGVFPEIRLLAQTALYPSVDSAEYLQKVKTRIADLSLRECVHLDTRFVDIDTAISRLAQVDAVVLPYWNSDEGASAAAATALAARRPLIATRAQIFDEIGGIAYLAEDNSPAVLAAAIGIVLSNAALRRHLQDRSCRAADQRAWRDVANRFLRLTAGEDETPESAPLEAIPEPLLAVPFAS